MGPPWFETPCCARLLTMRAEVSLLSPIAPLLASVQPEPQHHPWPRYAVAAPAWSAIGEALGQGGGDLMGLWAEPGHVHLALRAPDLATPAVVSIAVADNAFP